MKFILFSPLRKAALHRSREVEMMRPPLNLITTMKSQTTSVLFMRKSTPHHRKNPVRVDG